MDSKTVSSKPGSNILSDEEHEKLQKKGYYIDKESFAEGAHSIVYKGEYKPKNPDGSFKKPKPLACKVIKMNASKEYFDKFLTREMEIVIKLSHPNIVKTHSVLKIMGRNYIFMVMAELGDLYTFIEKLDEPLNEGQAQRWFEQMLDGVEYLHSMNIVHRDLKCENMFLSASKNIKIGDFGFAREYKPTELVSSKTFCGSVCYAPPELIKGLDYNPKKSDYWSLGIVLYICVNRCMPFNDLSLLGLVESQMSRSWSFRPKTKDYYSDAIKSFVYDLLEPEPHLRKSIKQMREDPWMKASLKDLRPPKSGQSSKPAMAVTESEHIIPMKRTSKV